MKTGCRISQGLPDSNRVPNVVTDSLGLGEMAVADDGLDSLARLARVVPAGERAPECKQAVNGLNASADDASCWTRILTTAGIRIA